MTNCEYLKNDEARMTNERFVALQFPLAFRHLVIRHSFVIRHWTFVVKNH